MSTLNQESTNYFSWLNLNMQVTFPRAYHYFHGPKTKFERGNFEE